MAVFYELWDLNGGERMGEYDSLAMALREVQEGVTEDGEDTWQFVGLLRRNYDEDSTEKIADGEALVELSRTLQGEFLSSAHAAHAGLNVASSELADKD